MASANTKVSRLLLLAGASPDAISDYLDGAPLMGVFANQVRSFEIPTVPAPIEDALE